MRLALVFLAGVAAATWAGVPPLVQDGDGQVPAAAVTMRAGQPAPFAGVLIPEATYRFMGQATLDLPICREENAAWERGHGLAVDAMENSLRLLAECQPRKSTADKVFDAAIRLVPLGLAFACIE